MTKRKTLGLSRRKVYDLAHSGALPAYRFDGERIDWCPAGEGLYINTLEGHMKAGIGDMLIEGVKGELYGCRADIFAATYEPVAQRAGRNSRHAPGDEGASMTAYYNEFDPYAAQWLRNLIAAGLIPHGEVDERSIVDVQPGDLAGFTQCHFFAGIGVWSYALRLAGWQDDRPVWTGSCPCQPFSSAGKRRGFDDERHLWPAWFRLIEECRPPVVFGEQVASKDGYAWLDAVQADLEEAGYAVGAVVLSAAGFGAPHGRHRVFFVADTGDERCDGKHALLQQAQGWDECHLPETARGCCAGVMAASDSKQQYGSGDVRKGRRHEHSDSGSACCNVGLLPTNGFWRCADWIFCRDKRWRPVEPGSFPLAHGASARVGRLRAYGNAIVPPLAAEVIGAFMDCMPPIRTAAALLEQQGERND